MTLLIRPANSDDQILEALSIRLTVFVAEQGVPFVLEVDARDQNPEVCHLLAYEDERPEGADDGPDTGCRPALGTCRIIPDGDDYWHLGRIAVRKEARGRALGAALLTAAHEEIARLTPNGRTARIRLDAQVQAEGFYLKQGYRETTGTIFDDAGIAHIEMERSIAGIGDAAPHPEDLKLHG